MNARIRKKGLVPIHRWFPLGDGLLGYDGYEWRGTIRYLGELGDPLEEWWAMVVSAERNIRVDAYFPRRWMARRWIEAEMARREFEQA